MLNRKHFVLLLSCLAFASPFAAVTAAAADYDELPVPVKSVPPVYPPAMKLEKASGIVMLKVQIDENGDVVDQSVSKSTRVEFNESALAAMQQWKFKPAKKGGAAVKATVTIPIKFSAENAAPAPSSS